jgi:hypothetical protein
MFFTLFASGQTSALHVEADESTNTQKTEHTQQTTSNSEGTTNNN